MIAEEEFSSSAEIATDRLPEGIAAAQQAVGDRHLAEIDHRSQVGRMAKAAMIGHGAGLAAFCNMAAASEASRVM